VSQSHTATEQWQSFELRMRRRRLDRCLLRAAAALDAEFLEPAREAIEEAERLSFEDPQVAELKVRLQALETAPLDAPAKAAVAPESAPALGDLPLGRAAVTAAVATAAVDGPLAPAAVDAPLATAAVDGPLAPAAFDAPLAPAAIDALLARAAVDKPVAAAARPGHPRLRLAVAAALVLAASVGAWLAATSDFAVRLQPGLSAAVSWLSAQRAALTASPAPDTAAVTPGDVPRTAAPDSPATETTPFTTAPVEPALPPDEASGGNEAGAEPARTTTPAGTAGTADAPPARDAVPAETRAAVPAAAREPAIARGAPAVNTRPAVPSPLAAAGTARESAAGRPPVAPLPSGAGPTREAAAPAPPPVAVPPPVRVASGAESLAARAAPLPVPAVPATAAPPPAPAAVAAATAPSPSAAPPPAPTPSPAAAAVADERLVRATLSRYEAAYSGLDAAAARAVWPSVDHRALARAFEGLESQRFSLDQCSVRMNGGSAQADCSGRAQWTPKVGGGAQTASRRWQFELKNTGGDWVIVRANVR
jgi:hypothetical protein